MKPRYVMLSMAFTMISLLSFGQTKTDTIKVWGNCDMCKMKIERAAKAAGASSADWNDETKLLVVSYDAAKTSNLDIQKKIASVGYDTQDVKAPEEAYKKLDKCCHYERPSQKDNKGAGSFNRNCCQSSMACSVQKSSEVNSIFGKGYAYINLTSEKIDKERNRLVCVTPDSIHNCCN